jgi:protoheme IX farnesyltransferase
MDGDAPTAHPGGSVIGLIRACHPEPAAAVTVIATLLALASGRDAAGVVAVFAAVLAGQLAVGWSNDWLDASRDAVVGRRDKPIPAGTVSRRTVGRAAVLAAVAAVPLSLLSGALAGLVVLGALASALLYNWPLKATAFSVVPYLVSFGSLAAFVSLGRPGTPYPPWWLVTAAALLGGGAHFANTLPDLTDDVRTGVRGLPHRIGAAASTVVAGVALLAATAVLAFAPPGAPSWISLAVFAVAVVVLFVGWLAARRPGSRAAFRAVLVVALADVVLLLIAGQSI